MTSSHASDGIVFISYSHKDRRYLDRLQIHLRPYEREGLVDRWDDTRLQSGANWREEIANAIEHARLAILLVSADFLASDFIATNELPPLLESAQARGTKILPVIVGPSSFKNSAISQFQAVNDPSKPLAALPTHKRDEIWVKLAEDVADVLREAAQAPTSSNDTKKTSSPIRDPDEMQEAAERALWVQAERERAAWFRDALDFLARRLARTFPGTSGLRIFHGQQALSRLARLLEDPLTLSHHDDNAPLWWWRGTMDMYIDHFEVINSQELRCLIGHDELLIDTIAVHRSPTADYRSFVYLATCPDQPTGVYPTSASKIERDLALNGYSREDLGHWNGRYISREEYDDGYAEIDGQIVSLNDAELRRRFLTPYNLFITSQTSVLNSPEGDQISGDFCRLLLQETTSLDDVVQVIENLPLPQDFRRYLH